MRRPSVTNEDELRWAEYSHGHKFIRILRRNSTAATLRVPALEPCPALWGKGPSYLQLSSYRLPLLHASIVIATVVKEYPS